MAICTCGHYKREVLYRVTNQGVLGLVDIKTKVVFHYMILILKHNHWFDVNNTL